MPDEIVGRIYASSDYKKFGRLKGNRRKEQAHIRRVVLSRQERPELAKFRPVLVDKDFKIIDGQHSVDAAAILKDPVYYVIADPGAGVDDARLLNATQRAWKLTDYLDSYAETGNASYLRVKELLEEYPISVGSMLRYLNFGNSQRLRSSFKTGRFAIKDEVVTLKWLDMLEDFSDKHEYWATDRFSISFLSILVNNPEYSHSRMLKKLESAKVARMATNTDQLREFERVYNFNSQPENQKRLF